MGSKDKALLLKISKVHTIGNFEGLVTLKFLKAMGLLHLQKFYCEVQDFVLWALFDHWMNAKIYTEREKEREKEIASLDFEFQRSDW